MGSSPIKVVEAPIIIKAMTKVCLRPTRSPKWPKTIPPSGRAKKPTAKVLNEAISATIAGISAGKKALGKMIAAAVP